MWSLFVLLADLCLVLRLGYNFTRMVIGSCMLWIVISNFEAMYRFGMYDIEGNTATWHRWEHIRPMCECDNPPCRQEPLTAYMHTAYSLFVVIMDFIATRNFARDAETEQASMAHTIQTVEAIAALLAGYDIDTVADMLAQEEAVLPADMHSALLHLEQNLRSYRPYLPKSCLPMGKWRGDDSVNEFVSSISSFSSAPLSERASELAQSHVARRLGAVKCTKVTVAVVNARGSLAHIEQDMCGFAELFGVLLSTVVEAVETRRGIVDLFVGDRILASFNASRQCAVHASAAVSAVTAINTHKAADSALMLRTSIGLASGRAVCGDIGCAEMRRFSLIGPLMVVACGMERAARAFELDVVCNLAVQRDAEYEHTLLLVPRYVRLIRTVCEGEPPVNLVDGDTSEGAHPVFELQMAATSKESSEWLYEVGKHAEVWAPYNAAMRRYLDGMGAAEAVSQAGELQHDCQAAIQRVGSHQPLWVYV